MALANGNITYPKLTEFRKRPIKRNRNRFLQLEKGHIIFNENPPPDLGFTPFRETFI
jgi:hypothetical protein